MHSLLIELSLTGSLLSPVTRGECHPGTDPSSCPYRKVVADRTSAGLPSNLRPHQCEMLESETELGSHAASPVSREAQTTPSHYPGTEWQYSRL